MLEWNVVTEEIADSENVNTPAVLETLDMQSEDESEHIDINEGSKCDEKHGIIPDERCWQKKKKKKIHIIGTLRDISWHW